MLCLLNVHATVSAAGVSSHPASPSSVAEVLTLTAVLGVASASIGAAVAAICRNVRKTKVTISGQASFDGDEASQSDNETPIGSRARVAFKVSKAKAVRKKSVPTIRKSSHPQKCEELFNTFSKSDLFMC
jgi:hypothetical protein